jgi:hypothetical protein
MTLHLAYLYHFFCYLHYFLKKFSNFFFTLFFKKKLYKTKSKRCFNVAITILSYFSTTLKINLRSNILINTYDLHFIILYISIGFLIHNFTFYSMLKNLLIIPIYLFFCIIKKWSVPLQGELNKSIRNGWKSK